MRHRLRSLTHSLTAAWPTCDKHPKQRLCFNCGDVQNAANAPARTKRVQQLH